MLEMLRDLVGHKGHADVTILAAIRQHQAAAGDPLIGALLHHTLLANRFWLLTILGRPFIAEIEARPADSFEDLVHRYATTLAAEAAWLATATEADLARVLVDPRIPGGSCSVGQAFMQVCLHSHGHRAQCAKLLRAHGAVPPMTDFILWVADRPEPQWPPPA